MTELGINLGTEAYVNFDTVGTVSTQVIGVAYGTINTIGTLPNITGGTITSLGTLPGVGTLTNVGSITNIGTIKEAGTVTGVGVVTSLSGGTITRIEGGTVGLVTRVGNVGTLEVGTISALPNLPGGSIAVTTGTVVGNIASGASDSGNPVKVGAVFQGTAGTVTNGQRVDLQSDAVGNLKVYLATKLDSTNDSITVTQGSITVTAGTIGSLPNIPGGTITRVSTLGTLEVGTISTLPNIPGGTLALVTTVSNITNGSVRMTVGTLTTGTLQNLVSGTLNAVAAATVTAGTINTGTINVGTFVMPSGTLTVLPNLPQGSINVTAGTVRLDGRTTRNILSYGTTFGGTAAGYATLVGSAAVGVGTSTWVNDISIVNPNGNITCLVGFGTVLNGTSVLLKGTFGTSSAVGMEKHYGLAVNGGMTNQDLVAYISGAGTIDVNVSYFISA